MMYRDSTRGFAARLVAAFVIALLALGSASSAFAQDDDEEQKAYWQDKYRKLRQEVADVRSRLETNRRAISNARQRGYPRGAERDKIYKWVAEDEARLPDLEEELANFESEARRAGAEPGWLRDLEDEDVAVESATTEENVRGRSADDEEEEEKAPPARRRNDAVRDAEDAF